MPDVRLTKTKKREGKLILQNIDFITTQDAAHDADLQYSLFSGEYCDHGDHHDDFSLGSVGSSRTLYQSYATLY